MERAGRLSFIFVNLILYAEAQYQNNGNFLFQTLPLMFLAFLYFHFNIRKQWGLKNFCTRARDYRLRIRYEKQITNRGEV